MDRKKFSGYIATLIIGIGFIIMAISDTLHSEAASILQVIFGVIFIVFGIKMAIGERRKS